jgi:hypothetical protein
MRGPHDIGGEEAGPIDTSAHAPEPWQKLATAMSNVLGGGKYKIICTDETRRTREALGQADYDAGYFERQIMSLRNILVEKGVLDGDAIDQRMAVIEKRIAEGGR